MTPLILASLIVLAAAPCVFDAEQKPKHVADMDAGAQVELFLQQQRTAASDPHRPLYHFSLPGFAMHDASGIFRWQGKYHLFNLMSPPDMRWVRGHAVSDDLVNWRDLPMLPKKYQAGRGQPWAEKDRVILSLASRKLIMASDPIPTNWTEHPVKSPGRDNTFWHEGEYYYSAVTGGNTILDLHRSKNLTQWERMGKYLEDSFHTEPGTDCACPNVLPLGGGKHIILFFFHNQGPKYYTGTSEIGLLACITKKETT